MKMSKMLAANNPILLNAQITPGGSWKGCDVVQWFFLDHTKHALIGLQSGDFTGQSIRRISSSRKSNMSPVWPIIIVHKKEAQTCSTSEKPHVVFKDLIPIALFSNTGIKDVPSCMTAQNDTIPDKYSSALKLANFPYVRGMITVSKFPPDKDSTRITLYAESQLISEKNKPLFLICQRICSASQQMGSFM